MRNFGILLHISSLPSAWGIGDLGPAAHAFAQGLAAAGGRVWQFLPVNPTSSFIGNSPYSSFSAFAGNPLFISPEYLVRDGYISHADLEGSRAFVPVDRLNAKADRVDYDAVCLHRRHILHAAFERSCHDLPLHEEFRRFCSEHQYWLHDYARFVSIKAAQGGAVWTSWPFPLLRREPEALAAWDERASRTILREKFIQFLFFSQWRQLRSACNQKGLSLLADVPIYVIHDSADVWMNPQFFKLDAELRPRVVSGVPPDYFSETGQRWGTPLYDWRALEEDGFSWWKRRLEHVLALADMARLDHFRGFCAYWEIPAEEETAVKGHWIPAPAEKLLDALCAHFFGLPFVAEDLGVITDDVRQIIRRFSLPGMHVLQFAFGGENPAENPSIPHAHTPASLAYTGTHDNPPTRVWFRDADERERGNFQAYAGMPVTEKTATSVLARMAFASTAKCAVLPMQDVLNLGDEGRMNTPGKASGNWRWRVTPEQAGPERLAWLTEFARLYGRLPREE